MQPRPPYHSDDELERGFVEYDPFEDLFSLRFLLFVAFALLFLTIFWQVPEQLEGEVYDYDTQDIVPDARVMLNDFQGIALDSAVTDADGHFNFSVKQRQMYNLYISKPGYTPRVFSDSEKIRSTTEVVLRIAVYRLPPEE